MKKLHIILLYTQMILLCVMMLVAMPSCGSSTSDQNAMDSVNDWVYKEKYVSVEASKNALKQDICRYSHVRNSDAVEEMQLNLGNVYVQEMSYDSAKSCLLELISKTSNDLHRAMADVDMMSLCLVTSMNKEFYDYRSDALERFGNVADERDNMTSRQISLWNAVVTKYHFVSLNYFRRMGADERVNEELKWLDDNMPIINADSMLYANYLLLKSITVIGSSHTSEQLTSALRQLVHLLYLSHQSGLVYFEILAANTLARYVSSGGELKPSLAVLITELVGSEGGMNVDMLLANHALSLAQKYHNHYLTSVVRCTLSSITLRQGDDQVALTHALCALDLINHHHTEHHQSTQTCQAESLLPYSDSIAGLSTEMYWITDPDIVAVPEWMALVREQLSMVYAAMGMRREAAYNRNIYFDILDATRQDLRVEQEEESLVREKSWLNVMLLVSALVAVVVLAMLVSYRRKIDRRSQRDINLLRQLSETCHMMSEVAVKELEDEEDVDNTIHQLLDDKVSTVFPSLAGEDWTSANAQYLPAPDREMLQVLQSFYKRLRQHVIQTIIQQRHLIQIDAEVSEQEYKYHVNKRDYVQRATTVSVVNSIPVFLNRALHEVSKLEETSDMSEEEMKRRLQYLCELIDKVDEYNDVLGHWIKVRQGMVSLNIERFSLTPLFEMVAGNRLSFENKGVRLVVDPTSLSARGDKSMTLFMINTLLDNARKYTPSGGQVTLSAQLQESMVVIEVADTGYGLSAEDVETINNKRVYDSAHIGEDSEHASDISSNKGYGFGLMNCKAIIEKLRKTNAVFSSCQFGVKSKQGCGSTFFFSLPYQALRMIVLVMLSAFAIAGHAVEQKQMNDADYDMIKATAFLDSVYAANVEGNSEAAVAYADSTIYYLNKHHQKHYPDNHTVMRLQGETVGELDWWKSGCSSDYELIISLRNEVAIASLALQNYGLYRYNNEAFTRLYTLTSTDTSLEDYCKSVQQANRNKKTILFVISIFLLVCLFMYFMMYYRRHLLFLFNLRQFMELSRGTFGSSDGDMVRILCEGLSDIIPIQSMELMEVSSDDESPVCSRFDGDESDKEVLENMMHSAFAQQAHVSDKSGSMFAYPLFVGGENDSVFVGVLGCRLASSSLADDERLMLDMMILYVSVHTYFSHYHAEVLQSLAELKNDDRNRYEMEQRKVYVRNQIVDNSLSTLKHETMYYPSRLKQMLSNLRAEVDEQAHSSESNAEHLSFAERIHDVGNLLVYYKNVYDLLASCAAAQLEKSLFRRTTMKVKDVVGLFRKSVDRQGKRHAHSSLRVNVNADLEGALVLCDKDFLSVLVDNVVSVYYSHKGRGQVSLEIVRSDIFISFALVDTSFHYDDEAIGKLFYIDGLHYDAMADTMTGAEYMVCRQIIREHDEHSPHRGCRVYVENDEGDGSRFVFTLPEI